MKYVDVTYPYKGKIKTKIIERKKIGEEMSKYIELAMQEAGYDEFDVDLAVSITKQTNEFEGLPEQIKSAFYFRPCIVEYEITQEAIDECKKYIHDTIKKWESLADKDVNAYPPRKFYRIQTNGKTVPDVFFCLSLCSHGHDCLYIHDYLEDHPLIQKEE